MLSSYEKIQSVARKEENWRKKYNKNNKLIRRNEITVRQYEAKLIRLKTKIRFNQINNKITKELQRNKQTLERKRKKRKTQTKAVVRQNYN